MPIAHVFQLNIGIIHIVVKKILLESCSVWVYLILFYSSCEKNLFRSLQFNITMPWKLVTLLFYNMHVMLASFSIKFLFEFYLIIKSCPTGYYWTGSICG